MSYQKATPSSSNTASEAQGTTRPADKSPRALLPAIVSSSASSAPNHGTGARYRHRLDAGFISQLLVSRQQLSLRKALPSRPTNLAIDAYGKANAQKIKRIPVGFGFSHEV